MDDNTTEEVTDAPAAGGDDALLLLRIEEMIKTHLSQMEGLQEQITKHKEMLDDVFKNDPTYQEHDKVAKEAAKVRNNTKAQIMKQPSIADLANKVKTFKSEKAELEGGLSDYLREYQRLSGTNEIEGDDGEVREIIYTAKLVRKSQFRP